MAYEHIYGIRPEEHIHQKAVTQKYLRSSPVSRTSVHDLGVPSSFAAPDRPVSKGETNYSLDDKFANHSLGSGNLAQHDAALSASASRTPVERPRMERSSTSTSGVSVVVPCKMSTPDVREPATKTKKGSLSTLTSSSFEPRIGSPSSPASQDREYKHWGRLDDPDSIWNNLHVERPKLDERRRFSSYKEYKKTRNQPMKDNDQLFKKRVRQSFAKGEMEVLSIDGSGDVGEDGSDDGEEAERGDERAVVKKAEPRRQILLVKRKGNLAGQNL